MPDVPEDNLKVNKTVLKEIKKLGVVCEQSFNTNLIEIYENLKSKDTGVRKEEMDIHRILEISHF